MVGGVSVSVPTKRLQIRIGGAGIVASVRPVRWASCWNVDQLSAGPALSGHESISQDVSESRKVPPRSRHWASVASSHWKSTQHAANCALHAAISHVTPAPRNVPPRSSHGDSPNISHNGPMQHAPGVSTSAYSTFITNASLSPSDECGGAGPLPSKSTVSWKAPPTNAVFPGMTATASEPSPPIPPKAYTPP